MKPIDHLLELAKSAANHAYAPYSGYRVGAALLGRTESGNEVVVSGCNIENLSYGATICAERNAIGAFVLAGGKWLETVVVSTKDGVTPCGMCRQVLAEFVEPGTTVSVMTLNTSGHVKGYKLADLLPHAFVSDEVARTEDHSETVKE